MHSPEIEPLGSNSYSICCISLEANAGSTRILEVAEMLHITGDRTTLGFVKILREEDD